MNQSIEKATHSEILREIARRQLVILAYHFGRDAMRCAAGRVGCKNFRSAPARDLPKIIDGLFEIAEGLGFDLAFDLERYSDAEFRPLNEKPLHEIALGDDVELWIHADSRKAEVRRVALAAIERRAIDRGARVVDISELPAALLEQTARRDLESCL